MTKRLHGVVEGASHATVDEQMFPPSLNSSLRGFVFDLDDTLVDLETAKLRAIEAVAASGVMTEHFRAVDRRWWSAYASGRCSLDEVVRGRWRDLGVAEDRFGEIESLYRRYTECVEAKPGAVAALRTLANARVRIAILTNGVGDSQRAKIRTAGLDAFVKVVLISGEIGVAKPAAAAFQLVSERLGLREQDCAMVGDNLHGDCEAALTAGYQRAFWIPRGHKPAGEGRKSNVVTLEAVGDLPTEIGAGGCVEHPARALEVA